MADAAPVRVDLLVGVVLPGAPGAEAETCVRAVAAALGAAGPALRWRLAIASAGTPEGAAARLREVMHLGDQLIEVSYTLQPSDALDVPYHGQPGRARALQAILREADVSGARACVIVDPHSALPGAWLSHFIEPLLAGTVDYVTPVYERHPFAGALVHGVVYPVFRALYGAQVRYPIGGGDHGCSRSLIEAVLPEPIWETSAGQLGIDLWLSATAATNGFTVGQATVGQRLEERSSVDLSTAVSQVVGTLFGDMATRAPIWQRIRGSEAVPRFGGVPPPPDPPDVDVAGLADSFRLGSRELQDVWAEVLPPVSILQWRRTAAASLDAFRVGDELWARTVYSFAVGYRQSVITRGHLLRAFTPLYLGWLASFVLDVRRGEAGGAEAAIDRLCLAFETDKPYLISQWRWPERFRPVKLHR